MARIVAYECEQCGSEIVVTPAAGARLSPIYCCGVAVAKLPAAKKSPAKAKKAAAKKPAAKKAVKTKRPAAKKKAKK